MVTKDSNKHVNSDFLFEMEGILNNLFSVLVRAYVQQEIQ